MRALRHPPTQVINLMRWSTIVRTSPSWQLKQTNKISSFRRWTTKSQVWPIEWEEQMKISSLIKYLNSLNRHMKGSETMKEVVSFSQTRSKNTSMLLAYNPRCSTSNPQRKISISKQSLGTDFNLQTTYRCPTSTTYSSHPVKRVKMT